MLELRSSSSSSFDSRILATRARHLRAALVAIAVLAALAVLASVAFVVFGDNTELERMRARSAALREAESAQAAALRHALDEAARRQRALQTELEGHTHDLARPFLWAPSPTSTPPRPRPRRPLPRAGDRTTPCAGDAHDPLNPCLGG